MRERIVTAMLSLGLAACTASLSVPAPDVPMRHTPGHVPGALRPGTGSSAASMRPIRVFAGGAVPEGAEIGPVEVHGVDSQGHIDVLTGMFVDKVAQLGGNAAVIDAVVPRFEIPEHARLETWSYPCATGVCTRQRLYEANEELLVVSLRGRAFLLAPAPASAPATAAPGF